MLRKRLEDRPLLKRFFERIGTTETEKPEEQADTSPQIQTEKPESGRSFEGQSNESYCLECIEGHTMISSTEMRHAIDRFRSAGKMTEGVTEKVRVSIAELQGIEEDARNISNASPDVKAGINEILNEVRWIRKEYGLSGKGLTVGQGELADLENLRNRIFALQTKAYALVKKCPTCRKISEAISEKIEQKSKV